MKFTICNKQNAVTIDEAFWKRAFNYAATELQIEHLFANVGCFFIPMDFERKVKFKGGFSFGSTGLWNDGVAFYVVTSMPLTPSDNGRMVKTFFHEMTHVKQLLISELIQKPRHRIWKGEKWDNGEYSFAPWEVEARAFSDKSYDKFLHREVSRVMQDENVHAYHPSVQQLWLVFPQDEVFRVPQNVHKQRERQALLSSGRDWLLPTG
jgi:hypothetical protein